MRPRHYRTRNEGRLSERQVEVLRLIARGKTNREIAEQLGITLDGAKFHVSAILAALEVDTREEAAEWWSEQNRLTRRVGDGLQGIAGWAGWRGAAILGGGAAAIAVVAVVVALTRQSSNSEEYACTTYVPSPTPESVAGFPGSVIIDWVQFIHFNGVNFQPALDLGADWTEDDLGPLCGRVAFRVDGVVTDPNYRAKDGDSSFLPIGTPVYTVRGQDPKEILAVRAGGGRLTVFQAHH